MSLYQKCDGNLPTCNQCIRFRRAQECEFSETAEPSTTRLLEQHIARLQSRIQELELEQDEPGRIKLHDPYAAPNAATNTPPRNPTPGKNWWDLPEPPSRVAQTLYVLDFSILFLFLPHGQRCYHRGSVALLNHANPIFSQDPIFSPPWRKARIFPGSRPLHDIFFAGVAAHSPSSRSTQCDISLGSSSLARRSTRVLGGRLYHPGDAERS